jgi:hypothetical protein
MSGKMTQEEMANHPRFVRLMKLIEEIKHRNKDVPFKEFQKSNDYLSLVKIQGSLATFWITKSRRRRKKKNR